MCPAMLLDALAENQSYFHGNKQARELWLHSILVKQKAILSLIVTI
jgi:hypothetical protein